MADITSPPPEPSKPTPSLIGKLPFGRYTVGRLLGQGTFAKVYLATHIPTGDSVAIKVISKHLIGTSIMADQIVREISVLRLVRHPNVVDLREVMATKTKIFFVMEFVEGGELFAKIAKGKLEEDVAKKYFRQLISAIDFCHFRGVSHRDLKPENLLLDRNGDLKVTDFGLSALPEQTRQDGLLHTQCGTPNYVAPEVLRNRGYDGAKADLWSCGVILYALLAGFLPFRDKNVMLIYRKIFNAEYLIPPWFSSGASDLVSRLLIPESVKRVDVLGIINHPWFKMESSTISNATALASQLKPPIATQKGQTRQPPVFFNAFDLISTMSSGFDLSGMFLTRKTTRTVFTSRCLAEEILEKVEKVAVELGFEVVRTEDYKVKLERKEGRRRRKLVVTVEFFEVAPHVEIVKFCLSEGDAGEYERFWNEGLRPRMDDVVWTWQS